MNFMKFSVTLIVVLIVCSCAKANISEKIADAPDTSAIFNLPASASSTSQPAESSVYTELADFLTEEQIELSTVKQRLVRGKKLLHVQLFERGEQ